MEDHFRKIRAAQPASKTMIIRFLKNESWAFSVKDKNKDIMSKPGYPKHYPNTVVPEYPCATNAKYEVVARAAQSNPYHTKYIAWLDAGYFRHLSEKNISDFIMQLPPGFDEKKIAHTQVTPFQEYCPKDIVYRNYNFLAAGFFVGTVDNMITWTSLFKDAVFHYLDRGLTSAEQQIMYAMFADNPTLVEKVQSYIPKARDPDHSEWLYLGYLSKLDNPAKNFISQ